MPHLITLTGPSGCGKSTCLSLFLKRARGSFRPVIVPKHSTRAARPSDGAEIVAGLRQLPPECDLVYEQYGDRYGVSLGGIFDALVAGLTPLLILNDVRTVEDVRRALGPAARSIFLFRESPSLERAMALGLGRGAVDERNIEKRFRKAEAIYRIYIENIHLFDHVIINAFTRRHLSRQVAAVVRGLIGQANHWPLRRARG